MLERGESMIPPHLMCPICSEPLLRGAYRTLEHGEMAHLNCRVFPQSTNRWPEGIRHLLCLTCGRVFESDSKVQRLCRACRSRRGVV
jgi:Fe2+ or Zn2+ uptake regulation protein